MTEQIYAILETSSDLKVNVDKDKNCFTSTKVKQCKSAQEKLLHICILDYLLWYINLVFFFFFFFKLAYCVCYLNAFASAEQIKGIWTKWISSYDFYRNFNISSLQMKWNKSR